VKVCLPATLIIFWMWIGSWLLFFVETRTLEREIDARTKGSGKEDMKMGWSLKPKTWWKKGKKHMGHLLHCIAHTSAASHA
jgi:hypothetical protein